MPKPMLPISCQGTMRGGSRATADAAPARDTRSFEMRPCDREQLARRCVRLRARPADDRFARSRGECVLDLAAQLLGRHDHELRPAGAPDALVDLAADLLQVLGDELLDVPLEPRLRPAALIVPSRLLL